MFLDEWLTYILFLYLYLHEHYSLFMILLPFAIAFNLYGYWGMWRLRRAYGIDPHRGEVRLPV